MLAFECTLKYHLVSYRIVDVYGESLCLLMPSVFWNIDGLGEFGEKDWRPPLSAMQEVVAAVSV